MMQKHHPARSARTLRSSHAKPPFPGHPRIQRSRRLGRCPGDPTASHAESRVPGRPRRQRGRRVRRPPGERSHRDLPDHALLRHGRARRRLVGEGAAEPLGTGPPGRRDAVGGGRGRRRPRGPPGRRARDDLHGLAGPPADDPEHVQDRRRADGVHDARRRAHGRDPRALDLRRPLRRHGLPADGIRPARRGLGPGGPGLRRDRARRDALLADSLPPFLRRFPDLARDRQDRSAVGCGPPRALRRRRPFDPPQPGPDARPAGPARHGAEPRHVLPGARGGQPLLPRLPRHRRGDDAAVRGAHGPVLLASSTTPAIRRPSASSC